MAILSTVIMVVAIIWVIAQLLTTHRRVRQGEIVVPPLFAATLVFILFILVVWIMGASPLHLVWLSPLSFVLGIAILFFPAGQLRVMACLGLLAGLKRRHES
jgi:membrane protein CcdC involved in cytochrome C biogenesis